MAKNKGEVDLDKKLIAVYNTHGVKVFLDVCAKMLDVDSHGQKKMKVNGEVCEVVLRVLSLHYLKTRKLGGNVFHSMVLNDLKNPTSPFRTELDFTLLTPTVCLTGECKSFVGDITVVGDCTLSRKDLEADVARQTLVHARCLRSYLEKFSLPGTGLVKPPFGAFCFIYSNGALFDKRTSKAKDMIPVVTIKNLYAYYDKVFAASKRRVYDFEKASKAFKGFAESEKLHKEHKAYVGY